MSYSYIIIDDNKESILETRGIADTFSEFVFLASANNFSEGVNLILELTPKLVFLEIDPENSASNLSLALINELYKYLEYIPKIIVTTRKKGLAFEAIDYDVTAYLLKPLQRIDFIKLILKLNKFCAQSEIVTNESIIHHGNTLILSQQESLSQTRPLILCIKSYGDYRYIDAKDICYLRADNNSTDIHLYNGELITAFKTLKHFEGVLTFPFIRIHNSYIVNRNYISRIHNGNSICYIKNSAVKLPFSKSYKVNIDLIISDYSSGNYLKI